MNFRVEAVDPAAFATTASTVLSASWQAPCLHYSPEYVAWQFGFPGELPATAVAAFAGNEAVGCAAVTPRTLWHDGDTFPAYILSFVAVSPAARGHRLGDALYRVLLGSLPFGVEVVAFAESGSAGERLLIRSFGESSFGHRELDSCRGVAFRRPPTPKHSERTVTASLATYDEFIAVVSSVGDSRTILNRPALNQWVHYCADPRNRIALVVSDRTGGRVAAAMIVTSEVLTGQGLQKISMLENICILNSSPDALRELFMSAATWPSSIIDSVVIASNVSCIDPIIVKAAGARALPSTFSAHWFMRNGRRKSETGSRLNVEII
jgi:hypothetical protein